MKKKNEIFLSFAASYSQRRFQKHPKVYISFKQKCFSQLSLSQAWEKVRHTWIFFCMLKYFSNYVIFYSNILEIKRIMNWWWNRRLIKKFIHFFPWEKLTMRRWENVALNSLLVKHENEASHSYKHICEQFK